MAGDFVQLEGQQELVRSLRGLSGPRLRKAALAGVRDALRPMVTAAKRLVPVASGRLRASLGMTVKPRRRKDGATGRLGPRRNFRYSAKGGGGKRVVGGVSFRAKAQAAGYTADAVHPTQYARVIEYGVDKRGRVRRQRGPAWYLTRALTAQRSAAVTTIAATLRQHVATP